MAQIGFWSRARAGWEETQVIIMEMNVGLRPGCWEGFIKYGAAVIWSGPRGYWPPREEITVKRAGETTSWWMYYLCKGLIDEAGDSFTEEASARSNLIIPPPLDRPTAPLKRRRRPQVIISSRRPALPLWIEYECEAPAFRNRRLCFFSPLSQGWLCVIRIMGVILIGCAVIWSDLIFNIFYGFGWRCQSFC